MTEWIGGVLNALLELPPWAVAAFYLVAGFIEIIFQPWPGTTIIAFGGCITMMGFPMGWLWILGMFWLGESLGSYVVYEIGARGGERVLGWKLVRKIVTKSMVSKFHTWMEKYGVGMLGVAKFTAGVNTTAILLTGVVRMDRKRAYPGIGGFCLLHNLLFYSVGLLLGGSWEELVAFIDRYSRVALAIAIVAAAGYVAYRLIRWWFFDRPKALRDAQAGEEELGELLVEREQGDPVTRRGARTRTGAQRGEDPT